MKKTTILYILGAILIGVFIGKYVYNGYQNETKEAFKDMNENIYLLQYGVYSSNDSMVENTKNLKNYFYYIENNKYHVIIGVTLDKDLKDKIKKANSIDNNIYIKKVSINNDEFIESLKQYDNLIKNTEDKTTILTAEKQILSKYEELIINNE